MRPKGSEAELKKFLDGFLSSQASRGPAGTPYKHIPELLTALRKQPGVKLAIATARPADNAKQLLRHMGLDHHFDIISGTSGTKMAHKPAPDLLLYVARRLGVSPKRSVMIGDTHTDIMAAQRAGMATIAMTYGMGKGPKVRSQNPDLVTGDARKLFHALGLDRRTGRALRTAEQIAPHLLPSRAVYPNEASNRIPAR